MQHGSVAGYPVKDLRVRLVDGSPPLRRLLEMAFKICGSMALKEALGDAGAILLEPIVRLAISVPEEAVGDVIGDLSSAAVIRWGWMSPRLGVTEIDAEAPLAEVLDYALDLRAITGGRGEYTIHFERYEELPAHLAAGVIEAAEPREELATH
ncbi:MAG: hypothetical protein U0R24_12710 [Solirubrobacterales bacterium]